MIQSQAYSNHMEKSKFLEIDSIGDSISVSELTYSTGYRGGSDIVPSPGTYIILAKEVNGKYISLLTNNFSSDTILFFKKVQNEGIKFLQP